MLSNAPNCSGKVAPLVFNHVAQNLYRLESSGKYYGLLKRAGKQFRRSLKTKDRKLAERRLAELRQQIGNISLSEDGTASFEDVARRWVETTRPSLKESSVGRRETCIKNLAPFFKGIGIRNATTWHCERWLTERGPKIAAQTFAHELGTMKAVFEYAVRHGLVLANPAANMKRRRILQAEILVPTREQFETLIATIRASDGRPDSQQKTKAGADLVELLAYSGCRVAEATSMRWSDVNFERNSITITGGDQGTKNNESRTVPMTPALRDLLFRLQAENQSGDSGFVSPIKDAKKCLQTACRKLQYPKFTHHDFRHLFATTCIESGVDIPTVSRWLGHKDGGALAMRVYGHLRDQHSAAMAQRVSFSKPAPENVVVLPSQQIA